MKKKLIALFATLWTAGSLLAEGEMMNVVARGYRVGERGDIVLTTKMADVVDITPSGISSIREGGQPVELKAVCSGGYKVTGWQKFSVEPNTSPRSGTALPAANQVIYEVEYGTQGEKRSESIASIEYEDGVQWLYLVVVLEAPPTPVEAVLRVTPVGYRIGESGTILERTSSDVVVIDPGETVTLRGRDTQTFQAQPGFGYKVIGWQKFTENPIARETARPESMGVSEDGGVTVTTADGTDWIYLVAVMGYDDNRTVTIGKSPFGEGTVGTNYGVYACQKGDVFNLSAVPAHDDTTGYDFSTFRRWSDGVTAAQRRIVVNTNETYIAEFVPNAWQVTFDPNGSEAAPAEVVPSRKTVTCGASYGKLPTPTRIGHAFVGWADKLEDGEEVTAATIVGAVGDHTLYAEWKAGRYRISTDVAGKGSGTVSGGGDYDYGSEVTLEAQPRDNSAFARWSDGENRNPRQLTVVSNALYTAEFSLRTFQVSFSYRDSEGKVVTTAPVTVEYGGAVEAPTDYDTWTGHHFLGWSTDEYKNVKSDLVVVGRYDVDTYTITCLTTGSGSGTVSGYGTYELGVSATLTAHPSSGSKFVSWQDGLTAASRTFIVESNATYTAEFELETYTVTFSYRDEQGLPATNVQYVTYGGAATAPVVPTWPGHTFIGWDRDFSAVQASMTVTAVYEAHAYTVTCLTVSTNGASGTVSGTGKYAHGSTATIAARPSTGSKFVQWLEDGSTEATRTFIVESNVTYTAAFDIETYTVTFSYRTAEGQVAMTTNHVTYGASATPPTIPEWPGHTFTGWDRDFSSVQSSMKVTAVYETQRYTITCTTTGEGSGSVSGYGKYDYGTSATLTAYPSSGSKFVSWQDGVTAASRTFIVVSNATYTAAFALAKYTVTFSYRNAAGEEVTTNHVGVLHGTSVEPPSDVDSWAGHVFTGWSSDAYENVTGDLRIKAKYEAVPCKVSCASTGSGSGSISGARTYEYGDTVFIRATPDTGSAFVQWVEDGVTSAARTFVITNDVMLTAEFGIASYQVTFIYNDENGNSVSTNQTVVYHGSAEPPAFPEWPGHVFVNWSTDDYLDVTQNLTGNRAVKAIYDAKTYDVAFAYRDREGNVVTSMTQHVVSGRSAQPPPENVVDLWTGHAFQGWQPDYTVISSDVIITAVYDVKQHEVTFSYHSFDGEVRVQPVTVTHGEPVPEGAVPNAALVDNWPNHHFLGWSTDAYKNAITNDLEVFAQYDGFCSIIYKDVNGTNYWQEITVQNTQLVTNLLPIATLRQLDGYVFEKGGHEFVGWTNAMGKVYADAEEIVVMNGMTEQLLPIWKPAKYTIVCKTDGNGTVKIKKDNQLIDGTDLDYGTEVTISATPDTGSRFVRWKEDGSEETNRVIKVVSNATYTAEFALKTYTVTFVYNNEKGDEATTKVSVAYSNTVTQLDEKIYNSWPDHTFVAWHDEGGQVVDISKERITGDRTLKASYEEKSDSLKKALGLEGTDIDVTFRPADAWSATNHLSTTCVQSSTKGSQLVLKSSSNHKVTLQVASEHASAIIEYSTDGGESYESIDKIGSDWKDQSVNMEENSTMIIRWDYTKECYIHVIP